ncbi:MAG: hypothetical protein PHV23_02980 [Candidatus Gracilibacteria bacterium]|nr:hypothetical protein [Candidatus Gracilibacteria bacterium]
MNNGNNTSQDRGLTDQLFNKIENQNLSYSKMSEDEKQKYWIGVITKVFHDLGDGEKINISEYRKTESNIYLFLNSIIENIESYHWEDRKTIISKYFILDEKAKKALEIQSNISNSSEQVENTISIKTTKIKGIDFSFEELTKKMGDLFYEPLASMLSSISIELEKQNDSNEELVKLLIESSNHILNAWNHCKPYITDINELEKNSKHTFDIKDTSLTNEQISKAIAYLENDRLKEFLELLSIKLQKDGEADSGRKRFKLAGELIAASTKIKEASNLL